MLNTIKEIPKGEPQTMDIQYTYDCKMKIIREMLLTTIHRNRKVVIHHQGSYESHSHIHKNTHFILLALLKVHPCFFPS